MKRLYQNGHSLQFWSLSEALPTFATSLNFPLRFLLLFCSTINSVIILTIFEFAALVKTEHCSASAVCQLVLLSIWMSFILKTYNVWKRWMAGGLRIYIWQRWYLIIWITSWKTNFNYVPQRRLVLYQRIAHRICLNLIFQKSTS